MGKVTRRGFLRGLAGVVAVIPAAKLIPQAMLIEPPPAGPFGLSQVEMQAILANMHKEINYRLALSLHRLSEATADTKTVRTHIRSFPLPDGYDWDKFGVPA